MIYLQERLPLPAMAADQKQQRVLIRRYRAIAGKRAYTQLHFTLN